LQDAQAETADQSLVMLVQYNIIIFFCFMPRLSIAKPSNGFCVSFRFVLGFVLKTSADIHIEIRGERAGGGDCGL
jgi:hypothetical protein